MAAMLQTMSPTVQRAWLENAAAHMPPNDQMHAPAPQALLVEWTKAACLDDSTPPGHVANLAKYWVHALRFPEHSPSACEQLGAMLQTPHTRMQAQEALQAMLAAEIQPLRLMRLCTLALPLLDPHVLAEHLDRVLNGEIPTGKKLKLSQLSLNSWTNWLAFLPYLDQETFQKGLMLHVRAHLTTRQNVNPAQRVPEAWAMLLACEQHLPEVPPGSIYACMGLPKTLAVFMTHADAQTLYHAPWPQIQQLYSNEPKAFTRVWRQLFEEHRNVLIAIVADIEEHYHPDILAWYLDATDYMLEEERCKTMLALVVRHPAWSPLLLKMLHTKQGLQKLGTHLLGTHAQTPANPCHLPGPFLRSLTPGQWSSLLGNAHASNTEMQLASAWNLVQAHDLTALQGCPALQKMTLRALQTVKHATPKVSAWDIHLGAPAFYASMVKRYVPEPMQMAWFDAWTAHPTQDCMLIQAFQWFNPDVVVPPVKELLVLRQAMENISLLDILMQLNKNIETFSLPDMVE